MSQNATIEKFRLALGKDSFIEFIRSLKTSGVHFYIRGKNPCISHPSSSKNIRIRTNGLLPEFLKCLSVWDDFDYGIDLTHGDGEALDLRLHWIVGSEYRSDVAKENIKALIYFKRSLGFDNVKDAMTVAQRRIGADKIDERFRYFCGICHSMIKDANRTSAPGQPQPQTVMS